MDASGSETIGRIAPRSDFHSCLLSVRSTRILAGARRRGLVTCAIDNRRARRGRISQSFNPPCYSPIRDLLHGRHSPPQEFDELHLLFSAHTRPVAAKRIPIFSVVFRPSTCSALGFHVVRRIATRATMSRKKISHAVLLIGGDIAGRRVDRLVRHIGILISNKDQASRSTRT